jgi:hypothetical protein
MMTYPGPFSILRTFLLFARPLRSLRLCVFVFFVVIVQVLQFKEQIALGSRLV